MFKKRLAHQSLKLSVFVIALMLMVQCATKSAPAPELPDNILGIKPGISKEEAENRLREVAEFKDDADKRQQVWLPKNDPRFNNLAVGYTKDGRLRYITAFSEEGKVEQRMRFSEVGDLSKAKREVTEPHYRYTWEIPAVDGKPGYIVTAYGTNDEYLTMYSLAEKAQQADKNKKDK